jgi:hypothetical protein
MRKVFHQPVPITSPAKFKEIDNRRKEINRLNRQRAKAMEKRVARYLDGTQTPQSGAGSAKGDILIDFTNRPGKYMIECKMSAVRDKGVPMMQLLKKWIPKMNKDASAMRAQFPILVIHYHEVSGDWVIVEMPHLHKIGVFPAVIDPTEPQVFHYDTLAKAAKIHLPQAKQANNRPYYSLLSIDSVLYYFMTLEYFKDIMKEI